MKIKELITELAKWHPESNVSVIAHNKEEDFTITCGGGYDGMKDFCHPSITVRFYVDRLNHCEQSPRESARYIPPPPAWPKPRLMSESNDIDWNDTSLGEKR